MCTLCRKKTSLCSRACLQHVTLHCWALGQCIRFFASIPIHRAVQSALLFLTNVLCSLGPWHQTAPLCDVTVHVITTHLIWVLLSKLLGRLYCRPHCYFFTCNNSYAQPRLKSWRGPQMAILLLFLLHPYSFPVIAAPMFRPFLCLLLILFANLNSAKRSREHYKLPTLPSEESDSPLQKLEGTKHIWSPWSPKLEGTRPTDPQSGCAYAVILFTYDMTFLFSQVLDVVERRTRASVLYRFCIDNVDYVYTVHRMIAIEDLVRTTVLDIILRHVKDM